MISTREHSLQQIHQPHELLVLPERFLKIRDLMANSGSDAQALADIVHTDVAISAKVLKIANSAAYNPMCQPLASLPKAIARLGLATSAQVAMSMSLYYGVRMPIALRHMRYFWAHSFAVSQVCALMGREMRADAPCHEAELFMMGLLHDVGCLLMAIHIDPSYFERDVLNNHGAELCVLEQKMYGLDHAEVGAVLLRDWRLPESCIQAVEQHHVDDADVLDAQICSHADQYVHAHDAEMVSIEAVQDWVALRPRKSIRACIAESEHLSPWLKPQ